MEIMPKNIESVICSNNVELLHSMRAVLYNIKTKDGNIGTYIESYKYRLPEQSNCIIRSNMNFVNGFKLVEFNDNRYGYIREEDHLLMPYRYDIASDFNEFGLAIVGKNGSVSWINKNFEYLNYKGEMVKENSNPLFGFEGWKGLYNFNDSANPLSRVFCVNEEYGSTSYVDSFGKIKVFYQYGGTSNMIEKHKEFYTGTNFDKDNYAIADDFILLSNGLCISKDDLIKLVKERGFIESLFNNDIEIQNALKKIKKI